jgi:hypothetical protein
VRGGALSRTQFQEELSTMRRPREPIDFPVLQLSATDTLNLATLFEGVLITGSPGSGKSSCSGRNLSEALLRVPDIGGLILTAKKEETDT